MSKIRAIVESTKIDNKNLKVENGLSLVIDRAGKNILFATGRSTAFLQNAKQLNFDIRNVDYLIISHAHLDHAGRLRNFLINNTKARVYLHKKAMLQYYIKAFNILPLYIGLDRCLLKDFPERLELIEKDTEIIYGLNLHTGIEQVSALPSSNKSLFVKENVKLVKDRFDHEIVLTVQNEQGLIVFTGCPHSGIINIIDRVRKKFLIKRILLFLAGIIFIILLPKFQRNQTILPVLHIN